MLAGQVLSLAGSEFLWIEMTAARDAVDMTMVVRVPAAAFHLFALAASESFLSFHERKTRLVDRGWLRCGLRCPAHEY